MTWIEETPIIVEIALNVGVLPTRSVASALEIETMATGDPEIGSGAIEEGWGTDGTFTIADATYGALETGGRLAGETVDEDQWTDITQWVRKVEVGRRGSRFGGPEAATMRVELDDGDRRFDPFNTTGPYASGGVSLCRQGRRIRCYAEYGPGATPVYLFTGFVQDWPADLAMFPSQYRTVTATDWFGVLAAASFAAQGSTGGGESVTARIRRWLDLYGVRLEEQDIGISDVLCQATTLEGSPLPAIRAAAASDGGPLWVTGSGVVTFRARTDFYAGWAVNTPQWTLTNAATLPDAGLRYEGVPQASTDRDAVSRVVLTRVGGTAQTATSSDLANVSGIITYTRSDLVNNSDTDVNTVANWLLGWQTSTPNTITGVTIRPDVFGGDSLRAALYTEYLDRVAISHESPVGGYTVSREALVLGISHTIDSAGPTWRTTWQLLDVTDTQAFQIAYSAIEGNDPIL